MYILTVNFVLYYNGHDFVQTLTGIKDSGSPKRQIIKDIGMDSRNQENHLKKYDEKSLEKLQSKTVFTNPSYLFVFKKTEKIVAALYLITNLISDTEPIKAQIRKLSLDIMSDTLNLKRLPSTQFKQTVTETVVTISEIISLLKVASISEQVSPMNHSIVQRELTLLMNNLESMDQNIFSNSSLILLQDFFNVPEPIPASFPINFSNKGQYRTPVAVKDNQVQQAPKDNLKDNRRESIINLLKGGKSFGIKDFAKEIKDCSEKTIQRELLVMVEKGVLKKTGERRWSLYSLA